MAPLTHRVGRFCLDSLSVEEADKDKQKQRIPHANSLAPGSLLSVMSRGTLRPLNITGSCGAGEGLLSPSQILVALHSMRTGKDGVPLLAVMTALTICLAQRQTFNRAALAVALEQLVDRCRHPACFLMEQHWSGSAQNTRQSSLHTDG